jgi:hypothetical protein
VKNNAGMLPEHLSNQERIRKVLEGDEVKIAKIEIPREAHRKVIGAKGAKIAEIRAASGCQVCVLALCHSSCNTLVLHSRSFLPEVHSRRSFAASDYRSQA